MKRKARKSQKIARPKNVPRGTKAPKAEPAAGRRPPPDPTRATRHAIAAELKIHHSTLLHYMAFDGAPEPDKWLRFNKEEVRAWIKLKAPRALDGVDPKVASFKDRKLELEVLEKEHDLAIRLGKVIPKDEVLETIDALIVEVQGIYQQKFEHELPTKCRGKNEIELRQMFKAALVEAANAFKSGRHRVASQVIEPISPTTTQPLLALS